MGLLIHKVPRAQNDEAFNQGEKKTIHWCQEDFESFSETRLWIRNKKSTPQLFFEFWEWFS